MARAKRAALRALEGGDRDADPETTKGLFALPFMARAMKKKREAAEKEAKALLEEIEKAERGAAKSTRPDEDERDERVASAGKTLAASEPRVAPSPPRVGMSAARCTARGAARW